jgi:hypothetical protein
MAFSYSPKPVIDNSLVLYLDAANPKSYASGSTTWSDVSRAGNSGTLVNGVLYNTANAGNMVFEGTNSSVGVGNNVMFNILDITVSIWAYQTTPNSYNPLITRYGQTSNFNGWSISYSNTTNKFSFGGRESIAAYINAPTVNTYSLNRWHHIVGTKSGSTWRIYVNGILDNSTTAGTGTTSFLTSNMYVGAELGNAYNYYGASNIANVQIYNRALSAAEILQNYNATKSRFGLK